MSEEYCVRCRQKPVHILSDGTPAAGMCNDCFVEALIESIKAYLGESNTRKVDRNEQGKVRVREV
jgi:hypothetical protein